MDSLVVLMDDSSPYESTLIRLNQVAHVRGQSSGEDLGEELRKTVDQTDGPKVPDFICFIFLAKENHVGLVNQEEAPSV